MKNITASKRAAANSRTALDFAGLPGPPELADPPDLDEKNPASAPSRLAAAAAEAGNCLPLVCGCLKCDIEGHRGSGDHRQRDRVGERQADSGAGRNAAGGGISGTACRRGRQIRRAVQRHGAAERVVRHDLQLKRGRKALRDRDLIRRAIRWRRASEDRSGHARNLEIIGDAAGFGRERCGGAGVVHGERGAASVRPGSARAAHEVTCRRREGHVIRAAAVRGQ